STTWPPHTPTETRASIALGSAANAALIFPSISRSLTSEGRLETKKVSTLTTPGVARAIRTASAPAGEPGGTTPPRTTTPWRTQTSRLPVPGTGEASRLVLIEASISVSDAWVDTERTSVATPYVCETTDTAAMYGLQPYKQIASSSHQSRRMMPPPVRGTSE